MQIDTASFIATIAYGLLALAGLIAAGIGFGSVLATVCGVLAAGAAYLAQMQFTDGQDARGWALQIASVVLFMGGVVALCF